MGSPRPARHVEITGFLAHQTVGESNRRDARAVCTLALPAAFTFSSRCPLLRAIQKLTIVPGAKFKQGLILGGVRELVVDENVAGGAQSEEKQSGR